MSAPTSPRANVGHVVNDRLDHTGSVHRSQLKKPKKNCLVAQVTAQLAAVSKTQNEISERLQKSDAESKLQLAKLMSSVANTIVDGTAGPKKIPLRRAQSLERDKALERLARIMADEEEEEQAEEDEAAA